MVAEQEGDAGLAQLRELLGLCGFGGVDWEVDEAEAGVGGFCEDGELIGEFAAEVTAVRLAAAGSDRGDGGVVAEELMQLRECDGWVRK